MHWTESIRRSNYVIRVGRCGLNYRITVAAMSINLSLTLESRFRAEQYCLTYKETGYRHIFQWKLILRCVSLFEGEIMTNHL